VTLLPSSFGEFWETSRCPSHYDSSFVGAAAVQPSSRPLCSNTGRRFNYHVRWQ
jgi:hypothetical protein